MLFTKNEGAAQPQNELTVIRDGKAVTTSRKIAEVFSKRHGDVLRDIRELGCSEGFNQRNFAPVNYLDAKGEARPEFLITKDGFTILAMGYTGEKAMAFKEMYIARFNQMEEQLRAATSPHLSPNLSALLADIAQVQNKELRLRMMAKLLPGMELPAHPHTTAANAPASWAEAFNQQYGSHTHAFIEHHAKRWLWQGRVLNADITAAYQTYIAEHSLRHPLSATSLTHAIAAYCAHHSIPYRYGVSVRIGKKVRKAKLFGNAALKGGSYA